MKRMINLLGTLLVLLAMSATPASADKDRGDKTAADEKPGGKGDGEKPAIVEKGKGKGDFDKPNLKEKGAGKGDGEKPAVVEKGKGKGDFDKADFKEKSGGKGDGEKTAVVEKGKGKGDFDKPNIKEKAAGKRDAEKAPVFEKGKDKGGGDKFDGKEKGGGKGDGEKAAVVEKGKGKGDFDKANFKEKAGGKGDGEKPAVVEKGKGKGEGDKVNFKEKAGGKGDGEKKGFNEKGGGKGDGDKSGLNKKGDPADHAWADFLREAKRTAAAGVYPQVTLSSGSVLAGVIESLDASRLALRFGGGTRSFSTLHVSSVAFDWLRPELAGHLQAGRPGVLLATGDFVDGEIRALVAGRVTVNSVLFGLRDYAVPGEALAMTVGKVVPGTAEFTVRLRNGSRLLARSLGAQDQQLVVEESVAGRLAVALEDMVEVYRTPSAEAAR